MLRCRQIRTSKICTGTATTSARAAAGSFTSARVRGRSLGRRRWRAGRRRGSFVSRSRVATLDTLPLSHHVGPVARAEVVDAGLLQGPKGYLRLTGRSIAGRVAPRGLHRHFNTFPHPPRDFLTPRCLTAAGDPSSFHWKPTRWSKDSRSLILVSKLGYKYSTARKKHAVTGQVFQNKVNFGLQKLYKYCEKGTRVLK